MNRIKVVKDTNYTTINNTIIKDKRLSLKAKGLFLTVMSLPDDWDFSVSGIASVLMEGEKAIYHAIKELIKLGYCQRERVYEKGKIKEWTYTFIEQTSAPELLCQKVEVENLQVENLLVQKDAQLSKEVNKVKTQKNKDEEGCEISKEVFASEAVRIYQEFYPKEPLTSYQLSLIQKLNLLPLVWRSVLEYWKGKNNSPSNIFGLTDRYNNELKKQQNASVIPPTGFIPMGTPRKGLLSEAIKR